MNAQFQQAAAWLTEVEALFDHRWSGHRVDSGLPDFLGPEDFWRAYPAYRNLGHNLMDIADARRFRVDPTLVWFCDSEGDEDRTAWQQEGWRTGLSRFATDHARSWS